MSKKLTNKHENEKVKLAIIELYEETEAFKEAQKKFLERKEVLSRDIKNFMFVNGVNYLKFLAQAGNRFSKENKKLEVKEVVKKKVVFDVEKLEEKLEKDLFNEIIDKKYEITDINGLINYLKSCGVSPKKFKSFINTVKTVNKDKMNQLSELGDITERDIKGCYTVSEDSGYVKINILED